LDDLGGKETYWGRITEFQHLEMFACGMNDPMFLTKVVTVKSKVAICRQFCSDNKYHVSNFPISYNKLANGLAFGGGQQVSHRDTSSSVLVIGTFQDLKSSMLVHHVQQQQHARR
jgi:hypothetical protein